MNKLLRDLNIELIKSTCSLLTIPFFFALLKQLFSAFVFT